MGCEFFTLENSQKDGWRVFMSTTREDGTSFILDYQAFETDGEFLAKWHGWPSYYGYGPYSQISFETREWAEKFIEEYWMPHMLMQRMEKDGISR